MLDLLREKDREKIAKFIEANKPRIEYNAGIFQILEGNMKSLIEQRMLDDLGPKSSASASTRKAPVNVFRKIVEKLTRIYSDPVTRTIVGDNKDDQELLDSYVKTLNMNRKMGTNNSFFNAFMYSLLWIMLCDRKPFIRSIPNHEFLVMSDSDIDPTSCDIVIVFMPKVKDAKTGADRDCYWVFSRYQFVMMDEKGKLHDDMMRAYESDGENTYGELPFVYNNSSENLVMPDLQTDNLDMALLIPLLLTDLNYAVKYQAFSLFVGIDIDDEKIELSPNSILSFSSKTNAVTGESKPSFEVIKPTVDIDATLSLASSQMSLWLTTKGIRPGAIGQIGTDQFASGVSKMIDESDTYESVKKQIAVYQQTEEIFWNKLINVLHPFWVDNGLIDENRKFSTGAKVKVQFTPPEPLRTRSELIDELDKEIEAGFTPLELAVKKLFPNLDDDQIKVHIAQAKADREERNKGKAPAVAGLHAVQDQDGAA